MEDSPNCSYLAKRYLAITRAGRLRGLGSHLIHPENRTAQDTEADQLEFLKLVEERFAQRRDSAERGAGCREGRQRSRADCGEAVNDLTNEVPKFVTQARASFLLGIPEAELRRISEESGLGHLERAGNEEEMYYTYEELRQICQVAAHPAQTRH